MGALGVGAGLTALTPTAPAHAADTSGRVVHLSGDGAGITPREYSALLDSLCQKTEPVQDTYLLGGDVEQFERHWAQLLGKEAAVFMPSGTLANQLALGPPSR